MCFALGLAVAHQKKRLSNNKLRTDWKAVLPVINDIFLRECKDFKQDFPNGLPISNKLRSQYSDHDRDRVNKWMQMNRENCTPEEIKEMRRMRGIVFEAEERLSKLTDSVVECPGPNAATWLHFTPKTKKSTAHPVKPAKKAVRRPKAKNDSESEPEQWDEEEHETSEEQTDDNDDEEQENSEEQVDDDDGEEHDRSEEQADDNANDGHENSEQSGGEDQEEQENSSGQSNDDYNDEEERSNNKNPGDEESSSGSDDHSSDEDNSVVGRRPRRVAIVVEDEDEDAESASDEEVTDAADAIRAIRNKPRSARQAVPKTQPQRQKSSQGKKSPQLKKSSQRQKSRLNEVLNAHEIDDQPAPSTHFRGAFEAGTHAAVSHGIHDIHFDRSNPLEFEATEAWDRLQNGIFHSLQAEDDIDLVSPTLNNYVPNHGGGDILDDAIIQAKAAATFGNQDGLYLAPANQAELLRRHEPRDTSVERYNQVMSFKGLAPSPYPALAQELHHRNVNASRVHYDEGHALRPFYDVCKRILIAAFQGRRWNNLWVELQRALRLEWNNLSIVKDLIDPIVLSTGMPRSYVSEAVSLAMDKRAISSLKFAKLLAMPTYIHQSRGDPDDTLDIIIQNINAEPKIRMIHTNDVDFNAQPPSYTFWKNINEPGNDFKMVQHSESLYDQTGEVRRVMLTYGNTGQGKEVDLMLCDKPLCDECEPKDDMFPFNFAYAEQRKKLPLVHHKDVAMFEDEKLYFVPVQQGRQLGDAKLVKQDIHDVVFGSGKAYKVIFCDKTICGACKGDGVSKVADLIYPRRR